MTKRKAEELLGAASAAKTIVAKIKNMTKIAAQMERVAVNVNKIKGQIGHAGITRTLTVTCEMGNVKAEIAITFADRAGASFEKQIEFADKIAELAVEYGLLDVAAQYETIQKEGREL